MRSSKFFFVVGLTLLAVLGLMFGSCSDDKTTTANSNAIIHDQYDETQEQVDAFIDSTLAVFHTCLNIIDIGNDVNADTSTSLVLYSAVEPDSVVISDEWYLVYTSDVDLAAGYSNVVLDSIRFLQNGVFQDSPRNADALNIRHNWDFENLDTTVSFCNYSNNGDITLYDVDADTTTVTGTTSLQVTSRDINDFITVQRDFDIQLTLSNLKVENIDGDYNFGCPYSGTITATVELTYQLGESDPSITNWEFVLTFENGVASAVVTLGTKQAEYTCDFCDFNQQ
ncbi:MAG: hypothetical protein JXA92_07700 [candidate division Zixibacteria bacterium]|nr:hypothetical protein [candidate division Zixibacteria bacterium]